MSDPSRNVEVKARDPDRGSSLAACRALGATDGGEIWQRDTYFSAPQGRLKLREQDPGRAELIGYQRADDAAARVSAYRIVSVEDPAALRAVLAETLGVVVVVTKRRHVWLWEGVRIHLDSVQGLGDFLEFEAVAGPDSDLVAEYARVARLRETFAVSDERIVAVGYAALLSAARAS